MWRRQSALGCCMCRVWHVEARAHQQQQQHASKQAVVDPKAVGALWAGRQQPLLAMAMTRAGLGRLGSDGRGGQAVCALTCKAMALARLRCQCLWSDGWLVTNSICSKVFRRLWQGLLSVHRR